MLKVLAARVNSQGSIMLMATLVGPHAQNKSWVAVQMVSIELPALLLILPKNAQIIQGSKALVLANLAARMPLKVILTVTPKTMPASPPTSEVIMILLAWPSEECKGKHRV